MIALGRDVLGDGSEAAGGICRQAMLQVLGTHAKAVDAETQLGEQFGSSRRGLLHPGDFDPNVGDYCRRC